MWGREKLITVMNRAKSKVTLSNLKSKITLIIVLFIKAKKPSERSQVYKVGFYITACKVTLNCGWEPVQSYCLI